MGLLDDYDKLLRGKPKTLPFGANLDPTSSVAMTAGDELDPFMKGRHTEALQLRGEQGALPSAPTPGGTLAGPNQQRAFAFGDQPGAGFGPTQRNLAVAQADAAPPKINLAEMDFGLGDKFPAPKNQSRLAEGLPMTAPEPLPSAFGPTKVAGGGAAPSPAMPEPGGGLLKNAPMPPTRPAGLGGMPPTRSAAAIPLPVPRPAGLGGASEVASTAAPPMPPVRPPGLGVDASGGLLAKAPITPPITPTASIVPPAPPIAPIIPPTPPIAPIGGAMAGGAGSLGGAAAGAAGAGAGALGGLGGALGAIGSIASAFGGGKNKGPPPPEAKPPQMPAPRAGAESAQQEAASRSQAPQILQGILASSASNSLDPRKRKQLV